MAVGLSKVPHDEHQAVQLVTNTTELMHECITSGTCSCPGDNVDLMVKRLPGGVLHFTVNIVHFRNNRSSPGRSFGAGCRHLNIDQRSSNSMSLVFFF